MALHGLFIGIDTYRDSQIPDLSCAVRDAERLSLMFEGIGGNIIYLRNASATNHGIRRKLLYLTRTVQRDDTAIIYFAGHGGRESPLIGSSDERLVPFIIPYDAFVNEFFATAISMKDLGDSLKMIPCKNVIFIFDACYSGALPKSRAFELAGTRRSENGSLVFPEISGEGTITLAASQEYEPAYEDPISGHGIFTKCFIEALTGFAKVEGDHRIKLDSIISYLEENVPKQAMKLFNANQNPIHHYSVTRGIEFPLMRESHSRTLAGFPHMFNPLTIIVGDRREIEPKTPGDLFALSASPGELRWILSLGLPSNTEIISDKIFRKASKEFLEETFGQTNLLIIGSPAVNHVARLVNETAFFPFQFDSSVRNKVKEIVNDIDQLNGDRTKLMDFILSEKSKATSSYYLNQFMKGGFIDPVFENRTRGETVPFDRDYGTVSIARNPYSARSSSEFISILAAGVHLPGTTHAIKLLANANSEFKKKPMGGIFRVEMHDQKWEVRVANGKPQLSTEDYTLVELQSKLKKIKNDMDKIYYGLDRDNIDDRISFLEQLIKT